MADNICYENNGYVKFILNGVELMSNPKDTRTPDDKYNRNFAGDTRVITPKSGKSFKTDERFGNIIVPADMVEKFKEYNINMWELKDPDENGNPIYKAKIKLAFGSKTNVNLVVPKKRPIQLTEETVGTIDTIHVRNIDVELGRGRQAADNGKYQLWINTMYVYQDIPEDPFQYKFADLEYENDDEDCPF